MSSLTPTFVVLTNDEVANKVLTMLAEKGRIANWCRLPPDAHLPYGFIKLAHRPNQVGYVMIEQTNGRKTVFVRESNHGHNSRCEKAHRRIPNMVSEPDFSVR